MKPAPASFARIAELDLPTIGSEVAVAEQLVAGEVRGGDVPVEWQQISEIVSKLKLRLVLTDERTLNGTVQPGAIVLALGDLITSTVDGPEGWSDDQDPAKSPDVVDILIASVGDADERVCLAALLCLGKIGNARASAVLVKALRGEIPEVPQDSSARE